MGVLAFCQLFNAPYIWVKTIKLCVKELFILSLRELCETHKTKAVLRNFAS